MSDKKEAPQLHNNDRKVLAEHFKGKILTDKTVFDFCTRNKIAMTDAGSVEDFIYQVDYDERMSTIMPLVLGEIAKIKYNAEYISEEERKSISDFNDELEANIAQILEDNGLEYRELGILETWNGDIANLLNNAERRVSNMCALVLAEMAQERLGNPLTVKRLAGERAQIADRKHKKIEADTDLCSSSEEHEAKGCKKDCGGGGGGFAKQSIPAEEVKPEETKE